MFILCAINNLFDGTTAFAKGQGDTLEDCILDIFGEDFEKYMKAEAAEKEIKSAFLDMEIALEWLEIPHELWQDDVYLCIPPEKLFPLI